MRNSYKTKQFSKQKAEENPLYHNTWMLLKKYRDVVWSLEVSTQSLENSFETEYGMHIGDFLESIYLAGAELEGTELENHAQCISRSRKMLNMLNERVNLLREKHKHGEDYYWILYLTYLCPQEFNSVEDIIEELRSHIKYISYRTYYRYRNEAIKALSSILWGYTDIDCLNIVNQLLPEEKNEEK